MSAPKELPIRHRKIGPYRVDGELGRGGMARVYKGVHESLERTAAIKELLPEAMRDRESQSRFEREARALASFRHSNIVTVYDLIEKSDAYFLVMEYVDGPSLLEILRDGPMPPDVAAVIAAQLCSALDHAHFHRVIHRDLKPANVMITRTGEVKLMDFGIAKDEADSGLTKEGIAIGTPSYMSPEQVTGQKVDPRTDLFSLGVVMYEMLSGEKPFTGKTTGEVFAKIRDGKCAPITKAARNVPRPIANIVKRAMEGPLDSRYFDAAEMLRDLEQYLTSTVKMSPSALLIAFLKMRGKISEVEALKHVTSLQLSIMEELESDRSIEAKAFGRAGRRLRWLLAVGIAAGTGLYFTQQQWLPLFHHYWPK
ncbi:MAG: serine/threonine protein kinase [Myxococcaceae bacterium]